MISFLKKFVHELIKSRYFHFLFVGGAGIVLQSAILIVLNTVTDMTKFYYINYIISLVVVMIYSYLAHAYYTFKIKHGDWASFITYAVYVVIASVVQYFTIVLATQLFGKELYLVYLFVSVAFVSTLSFFVLKFKIFRRTKEQLQQ